jgi:hypothetical protein
MTSESRFLSRKVFDVPPPIWPVKTTDPSEAVTCTQQMAAGSAATRTTTATRSALATWEGLSVGVAPVSELVGVGVGSATVVVVRLPSSEEEAIWTATSPTATTRAAAITALQLAPLRRTGVADVSESKTSVAEGATVPYSASYASTQGCGSTPTAVAMARRCPRA